MAKAHRTIRMEKNEQWIAEQLAEATEIPDNLIRIDGIIEDWIAEDAEEQTESLATITGLEPVAINVDEIEIMESGDVKIEETKRTEDADWTLVEDNGNVKIYGYNTVLGLLEETSTLTDELVMVNMDTSDFIGMSDVTFSFLSYFADCDTYGRDVEDGWSLIKNGE